MRIALATSGVGRLRDLWGLVASTSGRRRIAQAVRRHLPGATLRALQSPSISLNSLSRGSPGVDGLNIDVSDPLSWACACGGESQSCTRSFQSRKLHEVQDVVVEPAVGLVYLPDGRLVTDSSSWPSEYVWRSWPSPPRRSALVDSDDAFVVVPNSGFYHWLIEDVPTVLNVISHAPGKVCLLTSTSPRSYVADFLKMVGMDHQSVDGPARVRRVMMLSRGNDTGWPHPQDVRVLREFAGLADVAPVSRGSAGGWAYISRSQSRRSLRNERHLEQALEDQGIKVLRMESLTFSEQIATISGLDGIVGPHGAGLANMVWSPPGAHVIEISSPSYGVPCYRRLASILGLRYSDLSWSASTDIEGLAGKIMSRIDAFPTQ